MVGDLAGAWHYNPGVILATCAWAALFRTVVGRATGCWMNVRLLAIEGGWWAIDLVLTGLTVNQQLHADLLA